MKYSLIILAFLCCAFTVPPSSVWSTLSALKFEVQFDDKVDDVVFTPKPTKAIKNLNGKTITIEGYKSQLGLEEGLEYTEDNSFLMCQYQLDNFSCCASYGAESYIEIEYDGEMDAITTKEQKLYVFKG